MDDVRAFVAVAEARSVSVAARELFLTQPAVTRRIQRLESDLGTALVDRRRRPFSLTQAGTTALDRCRQLLFLLHELRSVGASERQPAGELRIAVAHALTELTMAGPLGLAQRKYPQVAFRLSTGWSRDLLERVRSGAVDAAVVLLPADEAPPATTTGLRLAREQLVVVSSRAARTTSAPVWPADVSSRHWILNPDGCAARMILRRALERAGRSLQVAVETYDYELQLSLVADGRGLGLVPARLLATSRFRNRVRALPVRGMELTMTIWSVRGRTPAALSGVLDEIDRLVGIAMDPGEKGRRVRRSATRR